jgi:hypothetical protein
MLLPERDGKCLAPFGWGVATPSRAPRSSASAACRRRRRGGRLPLRSSGERAARLRSQDGEPIGRLRTWPAIVSMAANRGCTASRPRRRRTHRCATRLGASPGSSRVGRWDPPAAVSKATSSSSRAPGTSARHPRRSRLGTECRRVDRGERRVETARDHAELFHIADQ